MRASVRDSWQWLLALFTVGAFVEAAFYTQLQAFTPLYLERLGVVPADIPVWTGAIVAITSAVGLPLLPFWGALADRYGRQPIIVRSFVVHLVAAVALTLAGDVRAFLAARAVTAFALGNSGLMMTTLEERAARGRRALAFSIMNGAAPLGAYLGPLAGGPVVDRWGFQTLLVLDAALLLAIVVGLSVGYRDAFRAADRGPLLRMAADSLVIIGRSPRLRTLFPALTLLFGGWMLGFTYVPLVIAALHGGPEVGTVVGLVIGASGVGTLVLTPGLGALADRLGHWRVLYAGAAASVVLWPLPALAPDLVTFAVLWAALNGVLSGVFSLSFNVLSSSATDAVRGRVMSFAFLPVNVGFAVGPAIGSVITQASLLAVFPAAAVFTALGIAALWFAERQRVA